MKTKQSGFSIIIIILIISGSLVLLFILANVLLRTFMFGGLGGRGFLGEAPVVFKGGPRITPEGIELSRQNCGTDLSIIKDRGRYLPRLF